MRGCAAVTRIDGLEEDTGDIAVGMQHHWNPKMDWEGAEQKELLAQSTCIRGCFRWSCLMNSATAQ